MENILKRIILENQEIISDKKLISRNYSIPETDYFNILPEPFLTSNIYPYRSFFVQCESKRKTYLADNVRGEK